MNWLKWCAMAKEDHMKKIPLPPQALAALAALEDAGFEAWCVGGCVRDALLGRPINDFDITTSAPWQQTEKALEKAGFALHRTGTEHGTVTAVRENMAFEVTTYRTETGYSDGRHPDHVTFVSSIEDDLARRDFTVNAMAYHPQRGILDLFGGQADLGAQLIRAVGDPKRRFAEDGLRILRGFRFASQLGFSLEPATLEAAKTQKMMLARVSAERVTHEMDGLLLGDFPHDALMAAIDVLGAVMPEIVACKGFDQHTPYHLYDVWEHTAWAVQYAPATRLGRWSAFLHDLGKPGAFFMEGDRGHFRGHEQLSMILGREILERLKFTPTFIRNAIELVRIHDEQIAPTTRGVKRAVARLGGDGELFQTLLGLKRADALAQSPLGEPRLRDLERIEELWRQLQEEGEAVTVGQLKVNGRDVLEKGVAPGPAVGLVLQQALDAVIDEKVPNERDALLAFLADRLEENGPSPV